VLQKEKTIKAAGLVVSICGGWWSIMSGAISIPCAVLAFAIGGSAGRWFVVLAFLALWVCVFSIAHKSYQLTKSVLDIEPMPIDRRPIRGQPFQIAICNNSAIRSVNNLEVELVSLDDEIASHPNSQNLGRIFPKNPKPEKSTNKINPGEKVPFTVFHIYQSFGWIQGQPKKFDAKYDPDKPVDRNMAVFIEQKSYHMIIAVSADGVYRFEREFSMTVQFVDGFTQINLTPITK